MQLLPHLHRTPKQGEGVPAEARGERGLTASVMLRLIDHSSQRLSYLENAEVAVTSFHALGVLSEEFLAVDETPLQVSRLHLGFVHIPPRHLLAHFVQAGMEQI